MPEIRKPSADSRVVAWFRQHPPSVFYLSVITVFEIELAATALEHAMAVVTRNVREFAPMGVRLVNPWDH